MDKKNTYLMYIIFVLVMMILVLVGYIFYTDNLFGVRDALSNNIEVKEKEVIENDEQNGSNCPTIVCDNSIDFDELSKISKSDYNFVNGAYNNNHSINVLSSGRVIVDFENNISNISNAKDLILFSGPGEEMVYILTMDGYIYKYELSNADNNNYEATKVNEHSNIKHMLRYKTRKAHAGGCDFVVLIDNNDKYYSLDSYCV